MSEEAVHVRRAEQGECFWCERAVGRGILVLSVSFRVTVGILPIPVTKEAHIKCAREFRDLLDLRISQAERR